MTSKAPYKIYGISTVVLANQHNPSFVNPDWLKNNDIVPRDWEVSETITTPPVAIVKFKNGFEVVVEQTKAIFLQILPGSFLSEHSSHRAAIGYLECLPHIPYQSLGLNCRILIENDAPEQWITDWFMPVELMKRVAPLLSTGVRLEVPNGDSLCRLEISARQSVAPKSMDTPAVLVDVNFHHGQFEDARGFIEAISQWPERQKFLERLMDQILLDGRK